MALCCVSIQGRNEGFARLRRGSECLGLLSPAKLRLSVVINVIEGLDMLRHAFGGSRALEGETEGILLVNLHA